ncbi:MAG: hypothetical protein HFE63_08640 [Clostridiales bacterium]|nr:hypothetical protein [Clostridiales bacterium]
MIFDLHCDTLYEALKQNKSLSHNDLHLSFERLSEYGHFCQTLAMWSDYRISEDMAYKRFFEAHDKLLCELEGTNVRLCKSEHELCECEAAGDNAAFLAVEGGKLLSDDISRLDNLYESGVRFLTLVWNKTCKIGGAHDTDEGLTDFGKNVVSRCFELGIIPDISHASAKMTDEVIALAEKNNKVCIATHSNSYSVCTHSRNLTDERFKKIVALNGIVGISLAPMHLTSGEICTIDDIVSHIEHYMSLGGEDTVCLGCDLDGVSELPKEIESATDLTKIAEKLAQINYTDTLINKIFYANARNLISLWLN